MMFSPVFSSSSFFFPIIFLSLFVMRADGHQGQALKNLMRMKREKAMTNDAGLDDQIMMDLDEILLPQMGSKEADKIFALPGQPKGVDFMQYGGYVTVDGKAGRALFYYFVEAVGFNHSSKPLLLWLNGGPGCSSLGYGAMEELGAFRVKSDGQTLFRNPYAWNNVANVLFLESPAGVGFSYSNTTSDYDLNGDHQTAKDTYVFLVNWLERFPEYKNREFYIAGESYAGHYVTQLAQVILHHNELDSHTVINIKGIAIGNAVMNDETDSLGMFDFWWSHGMASDEAIDKVHKFCRSSHHSKASSDQCEEAAYLFDLGSIDIYNIYAPLCWNSSLISPPKEESVMSFSPCTDYYVMAYLNQPAVQAALHANVTKLNYRWSSCSDFVWKDSPPTILPILKELIAKGLRIMVYSGDFDGIVPITSTRYSVNKLNLTVMIPWKPWYVKGEVGGYSVVYKRNLTLATVRGAGHEVPSYQPRRALSMIQSFLEGKPLPHI